MAHLAGFSQGDYQAYWAQPDVLHIECYSWPRLETPHTTGYLTQIRLSLVNNSNSVNAPQMELELKLWQADMEDTIDISKTVVADRCAAFPKQTAAVIVESKALYQRMKVHQGGTDHGR